MSVLNPVENDEDVVALLLGSKAVSNNPLAADVFDAAISDMGVASISIQYPGQDMTGSTHSMIQLVHDEVGASQLQSGQMRETEGKKDGEVGEVGDTAQMSFPASDSRLDNKVAVMVGMWETALGDQATCTTAHPLRRTLGGDDMLQDLREQLKGKLDMAKKAFMHGVRQDIFEVRC
jgi:hypothetical protein